MIGEAERAVFVWSMGVTQHAQRRGQRPRDRQPGARARLRRPRGLRADADPRPLRRPGRRRDGLLRDRVSRRASTVNDENAAALLASSGASTCPTDAGLTAPEMIDAAARGELDVLFSAGGNFLEVLPDPEWVERALGGIPLRVHMDIVLSQPDARRARRGRCCCCRRRPATRSRAGSPRRRPSGGSSSAPRSRGRGSARHARSGEVLLELAPGSGPSWPTALALRRHRRRCARRSPGRFPPTPRSQELAERGDAFQYGGPLLCEGWVFPTADGRAHSRAVRAPPSRRRRRALLLSTRRGKQFNSMVQERPTRSPAPAARRS